MLERNVLGVPHDHTADAASSVVEHAGLLLLVKHRLKLGEDRGEVLQHLLDIVRLLAEQTNSISSVGPSLRVLIRKTVDQQLHESGGERSNSTTHVANAVGNRTNRVAALHGLLAAGVLHDRLLENLPELRKALAKSSRKASHAVKSDLDDKPVVLGRLIKSLIKFFITQILLARVTLGEDGNDVIGELRDYGSILVDQNGRAGKLEGRTEVTADIGDGSTTRMSALLTSKKYRHVKKRCLDQKQNRFHFNRTFVRQSELGNNEMCCHPFTGCCVLEKKKKL